MANDSGADARPDSRRGRHRVPGARPPWFSMAGIALAVIGVVLALWLVISLVSGIGGRGDDNPGAAAPSPEQPTGEPNPTGTPGDPTGTAEPTSPSPAPGSTSATTPATAAAWSPHESARQMLAAYDKQAAGAAKGALVVVGKFGENVDNSPVVVTGEWGTGKLRNGLTVAQNHEQALRAGKLTSRKALPTSTTVAKVAVTRSDVRTLPVASARDGFGVLTGARGPDCAECQDIIVTGVSSTTMKVATTLGPLVVPAWSYEVLGTKARIVVPGLAPTALLDPSGGYRAKIAPQVEAAQLPLWRTSLSKDGRVFTGFIDTDEMRRRGGCWRLFAEESAGGVAVYAASGTGVSTAPCASGNGRVTVRLAAPLGTRTLLDTYWSRAIAP